ncbi:MAG TPA: hypothetical protein VK447_06380 [Myxococcaceae bacterium]|nr:hypothetical protein [Myxococcaceae bacterium]
MLRLFLLLLAGICAGAATYQAVNKNAVYAGQSGEHLELLAREYAAMNQGRDGVPSDAAVALSLVRDELRRRNLLLGFLIGCGVLFVGAWLARPADGDDRSRAAPRGGEEERLAAAMGNPDAAMDGARRKAAALLGVSVRASPAEVEAALEKQLRARDPAKLVGLAEELQRAAKEQREALVKARDLLVKPPRTA